jgi:hypothetical protein
MKTRPDILVIGAGAAGVAAAVAAARSGMSVVLLERLSYSGGKATAAHVGTVCGLYAYSKNKSSEYISRGFSKEFAEALREKDNTVPLSNTAGLHYLPYDPFVFKELCDEMLAKNKVEIGYHALACGVEQKDAKIVSVKAVVLDRLVEFFPAAVIDCSGEAIISALADAPLLENDEYQAGAQVFAMENVSAADEAKLGMVLIRALAQGIEEGQLDHHFDRVTIVPGSLRKGALRLKIGIPHPVSNEINKISALETLSRRLVQQLADFLVSKVPAFEDAHLGEVAEEAGIRVGRRPKGKYVLKEEDVLSCSKPENGIAKGSWPVEEWGQDKRVRMKYFAENDFYLIPADCLRSASLQNLFFAGRIISATDAAIASARVIGTCLQTGYAAGKLAAAWCKNEDETTTIQSIRSEL